MPKNEANRFRGSVYLVPITSARSAGSGVAEVVEKKLLKQEIKHLFSNVGIKLFLPFASENTVL